MSRVVDAHHGQVNRLAMFVGWSTFSYVIEKFMAWGAVFRRHDEQNDRSMHCLESGTQVCQISFVVYELDAGGEQFSNIVMHVKLEFLHDIGRDSLHGLRE